MNASLTNYHVSKSFRLLTVVVFIVGWWSLAQAGPFEDKLIGDRNFTLDYVMFDADWIPGSSDHEPYIDRGHISSMIRVNDCFYFGCAEGVNNTSNPMVYCASQTENGYDWSYLSLTYGENKPSGLGKKYAFIGTDSEGTPYLTTARYKTANGNEYKPYILVLDVNGSDATVTNIYELSLPTTGSYVNRQVTVHGSLKSGSFTAAAVVWDGDSPDYREEYLSARSHLRVWNFIGGSLVGKKMFNNFRTTFASLQLLSDSQLLLDDRGMVDFGNSNVFVSDGEEGYVSSQPSIYNIAGSVPVKESSVNVAADVYDCGARIFELEGQAFVFYTSGYQGLTRAAGGEGPTSYAIASVSRDADGNYNLSSAQPLWSIVRDFPTTSYIENYDRNGDANEQAMTRSFHQVNGTEAHLFFSTNGMAMSHMKLEADGSTSSINLELVPTGGQAMEIFDIEGRKVTDMHRAGIYIVRRHDGETLKIIRH